MTDKYTTDDLLDASVEKKPVEFNNIASELILDRVRDAIENKKIEIAKTMYNYDPEESEEVEIDDEEYYEPEEYEEEELDDEEA